MQPRINGGGWAHKLQRAQAGKLSDGALQELTVDAGSYESCAVGEYRDSLERQGYTFQERDGHPDDPELDTLAREFFGAVADREFTKAMDILQSIDVLARDNVI